jgi:hypothetical protein
MFEYLKKIKDRSEARSAYVVLERFSEPFLNSLLTVASQADQSKRGFLLDTMGHLFTVTNSKLIKSVFTQTLKQILSHSAANNGAADATTLVSMDIVLKMIPFLDNTCLGFLYKALVAQLLAHDPSLQKKAYKGLNLIYSNKEVGLAILEQQLILEDGFAQQVIKAAENVRAGAKKVCNMIPYCHELH